MLAQISDSRGFNAPPEVASGVLTNPNRIISRLPTDMRAEWIQTERVSHDRPLVTPVQIDRHPG